MLKFFGVFVPINPKRMVFASFGGRKYDDSPRSIYLEVCRRPEFADWDLVWVFVDPSEYEIPRGRKIMVDTVQFFLTLLSSRVWVSNSGMDRGIGIKKSGILRVETWHGTPLKKICGDEHQNSMVQKKKMKKVRAVDTKTIRCAQSEYDLNIRARLHHASKESFLLCGLPRNDSLFTYTPEEIAGIRKSIGIPDGKKVILYTPTYREYLQDENRETYLAPPIDFDKWSRRLGDRYVFLLRAHYAVAKAIRIPDNGFVFDVSDYPTLNDLYIISDLMISDYSSTFIDYSILKRPMFCFPYDYDEYEEKRGLYVDIRTELPCGSDENEDDLIARIENMDQKAMVEAVTEFQKKYAPFDSGNASAAAVDKILERIV